MLSQAQLDQFHREGVLILRQVFGGDELDLLRLAADRIEAEGVAGLGEHHCYCSTPGGLRLYTHSEQLWDRDPIFPAAAAHPRLLEAVGQCLGRPFRPLGSALTCALRFGKHPQSWHRGVPPGLGASICLDQATVDNGCLWALPGHPEADLGAEEECFERARPLEMAPGDLLFLNASTPRGARGNPSPWTWRALRVDFSACPEGQPPDAALAKRTVEQRHSLGLADPESPQVLLGEQGFTFTAAGR
jgi:hypothetical protein